MAFGDTDHDGRQEVFKTADSLACSYRILEEQGNGLYSIEYSGSCSKPRAVGDLDGDGRSELVGEGIFTVDVYEAVDATAYPTELSWSSMALGNYIRDVTVADTDRDGLMEIITSNNALGQKSVLVIYENTGDNAFELVFEDTIPNSWEVGNKATGDFDKDGLREIAFTGGLGRTFVYESPANNVWVKTWEHDTPMANSYATAFGKDTDGNGYNELFVMGTLFDEMSNASWNTFVYEATGNNTFVEVATLLIDDGYLGSPHNLVTDLDQDGVLEYVMDTDTGLWFYQAVSVGQWELVHFEPDPAQNHAHSGIYGHDLNLNGRPELIWTGGPTTLLLEYSSGTSSAGPRGDALPTVHLAAYPNPANRYAAIPMPWQNAGSAHLQVFDVNGRLVDRLRVPGNLSGPLLWQTRDLDPGIYLLKLEGYGQPAATGRVLVMH